MDQPSRCIRHLCTDTILNNVTGRKVNNYIRKHCCEYYLMPPGFEFRGIVIQLKSPMLVGLVPESLTILLPFTKPCYGTMLYEINAEDEDFSHIRSALGCKIRKGCKTGKLKETGYLTEISRDQVGICCRKIGIEMKNSHFFLKENHVTKE